MRVARLFLLLPIVIGASACGESAPSAGPAPALPPCVAPAPAQLPNIDGSVAQTDNGSTVCLRIGQTLGAFLHGSPSTGATFTPVASSDAALLAPQTDTRLTLPAGITAGFFRGTASGTATLSSTGPDGQPWTVRVVVQPK